MAEHLIAGFVLLSLIVYTLTGGADFGGGVWDLFAGKGERGKKARELIAHAIAPIWEANHVWLIIVVVLLFVCFPPAYAAISTALHIPLVLMLIGITLRGSAFVFRSYGVRTDEAVAQWGRVFAIASVVTPFFLGVTLGAVVSGEVHVTDSYGAVKTDFISEWLAPFPMVVGALVVALFAFLAAVYLVHECDEDDTEMRDAFRQRGLISGVAVGALAFLALLIGGSGAERLYQGLTDSAWAIPFQLLTGAVAVAALVTLYKREYVWARFLAMAQAVLVVSGLGIALYPYVIPPHLTIFDAAAPENVLWTTFTALCVGMVALIPAFVVLYRIFKGRPQAHVEQDGKGLDVEV